MVFHWREALNKTDATKVLVLTKYGRLGASSRMRMLQYFPGLRQAGLEVTNKPLLTDEMLAKRYQHGGYGVAALIAAYFSRVCKLMQRRQFDVLWIEKEALPWMPVWLERSLLRGAPYVLDYDDAIFHHYDMNQRLWLRRLYGSRLDKLMERAKLVVGGNNYLAQRARDAGAKWVEIVPTVVDITRYESKVDLLTNEFERSNNSDSLRVVWIGSPSTVKYLELLHEPLQKLATEVRFKLRVIGGGRVEIPGVEVELVEWSEATEARSIRECDIGVMPLLDSPWEQGKCGYKLIQYMASGLPVVASNVGVNPEIILHGKTGFLASTTNDWVVALRELLGDAALRSRMGLVGRQHAKNEYSVQSSEAKVAGLLRDAAKEVL